jgi:hypothetical protein
VRARGLDNLQITLFLRGFQGFQSLHGLLSLAEAGRAGIFEGGWEIEDGEEKAVLSP